MGSDFDPQEFQHRAREGRLRRATDEEDFGVIDEDRLRDLYARGQIDREHFERSIEIILRRREGRTD